MIGGAYTEAIAAAERACALAERLGLPEPALGELRAVELTNRLARGEPPSIAKADWLIETACTIGGADLIVYAFAAAATVFAVDAPERACRLLTELEQAAGARETPYYARQLSSMLRTALTAGEPELAKRLAEGLEPRYPLEEHALCSARAQLVEHADDRVEGATLYAEAATGWQEFGNVPERAHALLGQGRCLIALGDPAAQQRRSCLLRWATSRRSQRPRRCSSKPRPHPREGNAGATHHTDTGRNSEAVEAPQSPISPAPPKSAETARCFS